MIDSVEQINDLECVESSTMNVRVRIRAIWLVGRAPLFAVAIPYASGISSPCSPLCCFANISMPRCSTDGAQLLSAHAAAPVLSCSARCVRQRLAAGMTDGQSLEAEQRAQRQTGAGGEGRRRAEDQMPASALNAVWSSPEDPVPPVWRTCRTGVGSASLERTPIRIFTDSNLGSEKVSGRLRSTRVTKG